MKPSVLQSRVDPGGPIDATSLKRYVPLRSTKVHSKFYHGIGVYLIWLVVSNMNFSFHFIYGNILPID